MNPHRLVRIWFLIAVAVGASLPDAAGTDLTGWHREEVNWRTTGRGRVRAIYRPPEKRTAKSADELAKALPVTGLVIDSPPQAGHVPWIAVVTTDAKGEELDFVAVAENTITGTPTANPQTNYAVGIFDTGASAHIIGYDAATDLGLFSTLVPGTTHNFVTDNEIEITGVTGSTFSSVSYPLGLFVSGLNAIGPTGLLDTSDMAGQSNVSILVGQPFVPPAPDLPTAIGSPLSVNFTTVFRNDQMITVSHNGQEFTGPGISIYSDPCDPCIPGYANTIPLELRPLGSYSVQYIPDFGFYDLGGDIFDWDLTFDTPGSPSVIMGNLAQSVFFIHSVDLAHLGKSALDKDRFMFDTGAQVSVLGKRIGARLGLDPANPDEWVEIEGVTGEISLEPLFYIDSLQIPALGEWLTFTNVPMILLDVASPEGGTLDGIIGMNLFVNFNFVLRGGGMFLQPDPAIEVELISNLSAESSIDSRWMYQNLPGATGSNLTATASVTDDALDNSSYTYNWEFVLPSDVSVSPVTTAGGGAADTSWTFAAQSCNEPNGLSDSGLPFTVKVTVTGVEHGNTGNAEAQFGVALLGDVNNDTVVNVTDRSIINVFLRTGSAGSFTTEDCDINGDGSVNVTDRSIANAVWRGTLGANSVTAPCPFR